MERYSRVGEACGLWVKPSKGSTGVSTLVSLATIAVMDVYNLSYLVASVHKGSSNLVAKFGARVDYENVFLYPNEKYNTYIAIIEKEYVSKNTHPCNEMYTYLINKFNSDSFGEISYDLMKNIEIEEISGQIGVFIGLKRSPKIVANPYLSEDLFLK